MSTNEQTITLLRTLLEAQPENNEVRTHLARLLTSEGRPEEALHLLDDLPGDGHLAEDPLVRGEVLEAIDPRRAIGHYKAVVTSNKRNADAHAALARLYRAQGNRAEARHHYGIAVVLDEVHEDPRFDAWIHGDADESADASDTPSPSSPRPLADGPGLPEAAFVEVEGDDTAAPTVDQLQEAIDVDGRATPPLPRISFGEVGGMQEIKEQIRMRVIYPFQRPELFKKFKKQAGGGILLYGPPGCGKTLLARATAGECGATFVAVGISDILSRWLGESERHMAEVFETARRKAPTVLFFDELDALGMDRRETSGNGVRTTVNQMLTELDGFSKSNENVLVLGATNAPWTVDSALRRPGRFDRVVFVPPPDAEARTAIFNMALEGIPCGPIDVDKLAKKTKTWSGADITEAVARATEVAIQHELRTGKEAEVTSKMLLQAIKGQRASTLEWLNTAKNYASYSNQGGQYDDIVTWFENNSI